MPLHRFGKGSRRKMSRFGRSAKAEAVAINESNAIELNNRAKEASSMMTNEMFPWASSLTNSIIANRNGVPRVNDIASIVDEIENESGKGLNALAAYAVMPAIFDTLLPKGVHVDNPYEAKMSPANGRATETVEKAALYRPALKTHASTPTSTPDGMNSLKGYIRLDERVMAQLSIAVSLVINSIIDSIPSREIQDPTDIAYRTKRVMYFEDLVQHIHKNFGSVITLDPSTGDAFDRLTSSELNNFARTLLNKFATTAGKESDLVGLSMEDKKHVVYGSKISLFNTIYAKRIKTLTTVKGASVGKVWASKEAGLGTKFVDGLYLAIYDMVDGNARLAWGTRFAIPGDKLIKSQRTEGGGTLSYNSVDDAVVSILSLVALHVITYSMSYAIDTYVRLAIRGATRESDNSIQFEGTGADENANVVTPQIIFPGVQAALEMYGVSARDWDKEVAFNLHTIVPLMGLFLVAHQMYDLDDSRPGVKTFSNKQTNKPAWAVDREKQSQDQEYYSHIRGRVNKSDDFDSGLKIDGVSMTGTNEDVMRGVDGYVQQVGVDKSKQANFMAAAHTANRLYGSESSRLNSMLPKASEFGRRRKRRSASFGKKSKKSKRRSASFGKKKARKSRKHRSASFGKKSKRRSASFGRRRKH